MPNPSNSDLVGEPEARLLSDDRLGALRDYYLAQLDGQGDYEDIFGHIDALAQQLEQAEQNETVALNLLRKLWEEPDGPGVRLAVQMYFAALTPDEGADPGGR